MKAKKRTSVAVTVAIAVSVASAAAVAAPPRADAGDVVELSRGDRVRVDWTRGLIIAEGAAAADMRAPSASVARVRAEREARERAHALLRRQAVSLRTAGRARARAKVRPAAEQAVERRAQDLKIDYGTDGSVVVTAGLPVEAVREILHPPEPTAGGERGAAAPTALVVDARSLKVPPAVGVGLQIGKVEYRGPTVFVTSMAAARGDKRIGDKPQEVRAKSYSNGVLALRRVDGLDNNSVAGQPLVVLVIKAKSRGGKRK